MKNRIIRSLPFVALTLLAIAVALPAMAASGWFPHGEVRSAEGLVQHIRDLLSLIWGGSFVWGS